VNKQFRAKGGARLEVRAVRTGIRGKYQVLTDLVDSEGGRRTRQESPELAAEQAVKYLESLLASLKKA
jgi:hypothetical protein